MNRRLIWLVLGFLAIPAAYATGRLETSHLEGNGSFAALQETSFPEVLQKFPSPQTVKGAIVPESPMFSLPWPLIATIELKPPEYFWRTGIPFDFNGRKGYIVAHKDREQDDTHGYCLGIYIEGEREPVWKPISAKKKTYSQVAQQTFELRTEVGWWQLGAWPFYIKYQELLPLQVISKKIGLNKEFTVGDLAFHMQEYRAPGNADQTPEITLDGKKYQFAYVQDIHVGEGDVVTPIHGQYTLAITKHQEYKCNDNYEAHKFDWAHFPKANIQSGKPCSDYWSGDSWRKHLDKNFPYAVCINAAHQAEIYALPGGASSDQKPPVGPPDRNCRK